MSGFPRNCIPGCVHPNNGVMISCYSKGLDNHTRTQTEAQWNGCSSPRYWKHGLLLGELTALWLHQLKIECILAEKGQYSSGWADCCLVWFQVSLQITPLTETSNQSFEKDKNCNSGYHWPLACSTHPFLPHTTQHCNWCYTHFTDEEAKAQWLLN